MHTYINTYIHTYINTYILIHIHTYTHTYRHTHTHTCTKRYFSQKTAVMNTNTVQVEREISNVCPQVFCCGPGFWNIQYNSLLNLEFRKRT